MLIFDPVAWADGCVSISLCGGTSEQDRDDGSLSHPGSLQLLDTGLGCPCFQVLQIFFLHLSYVSLNSEQLFI